MSGFALILLLGGAILLAIVLLSGSAPAPRHQPPQPANVRGSKRYWYRSRHIQQPFAFDLVKQPDSEVRIYIRSGPSYGSRPTDGHSTHRYTDERGRHYVCVERGLRPTNFRDAQSWARYWADKTAQYIRTGRSFS